MSPGAATDEKVAQRIEKFKRKCGVHGEEALRFAYHAALPVALNPEFLHLLRINFFVDIERPLPYEVEFEFLLSSLCRQIDEGLYEIERDVRLVLLEGLAREFGQEQMQEVAMLLWEYVERQEPWAERVGLERAQQLTSLIFLAPQKAKYWLASSKKFQSTHEPERQEWFIAMQKHVEEFENQQIHLFSEKIEQHENIAILMCGITGFTSLAIRFSALEIVNTLNSLFSNFDKLADSNRIEKIYSTGDAYILAAGFKEDYKTHMRLMAETALSMQRLVLDNSRFNNTEIRMRIGISIGKVVIKRLGKSGHIRDAWGFAVDMAAALEANCDAGKIQVSPEFYSCLRQQFSFQKRDEIYLKRLARTTTTYWLLDEQHMSNLENLVRPS